ncbi:Junction-mediating and -regulatory protein [Bagarius yarrelli]|uniref:Junction-mediating and-regulatory protein n=1 Tax=Bagarius yarrelli TaxID=175774 RepID=A0A556VUA6_BAGYA|nr:Junction-mediating and -regulatory protein [Bagarius yarrelli]
MMMMSADVERMDSLDGWVAIKKDIFENQERHNIRFLVQWSEEESKFAVICHNRTLQQRRRRKGKMEEEEEEEDSLESSWAAMFSASELKHIHQLLSGSADALSGFLPDLSAFIAAGVWDTLLRRTWQEPEQERDVEAVCVQLERYFSIAVDVCGVKILLETLFPQDEEGEEDKYCENLQEFKRRTMEEQVRRAKNLLDTKSQGQFMVKTHRPKKPRPPDHSSNDPDQPLSIITLTTPTTSDHAPKPKGKGRGQKQREIPVHILLPPGATVVGQEQTLTPPPPSTTSSTTSSPSTSTSPSFNSASSTQR